MDVHTPEQRRHNMSCIRGKDTKPEMKLRRELHAAGIRFRLNVPVLPGKPDIVLRRYGVVILVHGCFWHAHGCPMCKMPATRREFWSKKFSDNRERDKRNIKALQKLGWRVMIVWECALRGAARLPAGNVFGSLHGFFSGCGRNGVHGCWCLA